MSEIPTVVIDKETYAKLLAYCGGIDPRRAQQRTEELCKEEHFLVRLDEFQEKLNKLKEMVPEEHRGSIFVVLEDYFGEGPTRFTVRYTRNETEQEIAERIGYVLGSFEKDQKREREIYERLKAKFEHA